MLFCHITQGAIIHLAKPEQEACDVGVSPEITGVLAINKGPVVFSIDEQTSAALSAALLTTGPRDVPIMLILDRQVFSVVAKMNFETVGGIYTGKLAK